MSRSGSFLRTIRFVANHPLNRGRVPMALAMYFRWQIASRLISRPVLVPFVEGSHLIVSSGETGLTGNIYTGLFEYAEMAFAAHLLRPGDLMVDVGANAGAYTILSLAVGANVVSFEPSHDAFERLERNVRVNGFERRALLHQLALSDDEGPLNLTVNMDTTNHVISGREMDYEPVRATTFDSAIAGRDVAIAKVDVEGWEWKVLLGAAQSLRRGLVRTLIVETNGSGEVNGWTDHQVRTLLADEGYRHVSYDPVERVIQSGSLLSPNSLFVREADMDWVKDRLATSPPRRLSDGRDV